MLFLGEQGSSAKFKYLVIHECIAYVNYMNEYIFALVQVC